MNAFETDREFFNSTRFDSYATHYANGVVCEDCICDEPEDMQACEPYIATCTHCGNKSVAVTTVSGSKA